MSMFKFFVIREGERLSDYMPVGRYSTEKTALEMRDILKEQNPLNTYLILELKGASV